MPRRRTGLLWTFIALLIGSATAQEAPIRIGVLNDQSGVYADFGGQGSVLAARMAVEDYGGRVLGRPVEVVSADHQNKPDIASNIARRWFDLDNVDAVLDLTTSVVALAVREVAVARNRALLISSASSPDMTGKACSPVTVHWGFDSYANANVAAKATVAAGGKRWFFVTGDNAGSRAQEAQAMRFLEAEGGTAVGGVRHSLGTADFSSYLMQAQASKADVIALANAGGDMINAIKQSQEFGIIRSGQNIVPMLAFISDIHALGLEAAQGLTFASGFYWDRTESTRAWSRRFMKRNRERAPTVVQAGTYSLVLHFLKAMDAARTEAGDAVVRAMKAQPVNDALWSNVTIRDDGRGLNDMYLVRVKTPAESTEPWDLYKILATVPGSEAYRPTADGGCPLAAAAPSVPRP
ncbi:ABC transporter substrate-binding protein [Methylobacterium sp. NEAU 140]|uniref:ABC transporter substrate-binding protein n=1 Tax=Methylobacterium sp. NEAU 140 TaxID=3064945 RepID=UPI0027372417|nr:ABC transporter substrate-binding protein [Methylobacterium sp. NEAU 140]MDP4026372.1 ABC transporter substrate-binding protein [Methylobacterium sp. NEAU 140]